MILWNKKITANSHVEFLPPLETISDTKTISKVRDKLDAWGRVGFGVLRLPDFGSRIKIKRLLSGKALLCEVNVLRVSRKAVERAEPFSGEVPSQRRPQSLKTLPFSPPARYQNYSEPDSIIPGSSEKSTCRHCDGNGVLICGKCGGNRGYVCSFCDGAGKIDGYEPYEKRRGGRMVLKKCPACHGAKVVICSKCDGNGTLKCRHCQGLGGFRHYEVMQTKYDVETHFELFSRMSDYPEAFLNERYKGKLLWKSDLFENMQRKQDGWWNAENQLGKYSPALGYVYSKQPATEDTRNLFNAWYRWGVKMETFSYYRVEYNYGERSYFVYLIGDDLHVHANVLPSRLSRLFSFTFNNIRKLFSRNNEEANTEALILAALYMAWVDGQIQDAEKERLRDWIDKSELSQSKKNSMVKYLRKPLRDFKITKYVHQPKDTEKVLQIAWQSALADGVITESEDQAFLKMTKDLSLDDNTIAKIKELAKKEVMGKFYKSHESPRSQTELLKNLKLNHSKMPKDLSS